MGYILNGGFVDQSDDITLGGLEAIAGVSTKDDGGHITYDIGTLVLRIYGTLTINGEKETLVYQNAWQGMNGGKLIIGEEITRGGFTTYTSGVSLYMKDRALTSSASFVLNAGFSFEWLGGEINVPNGYISIPSTMTQFEIKSKETCKYITREPLSNTLNYTQIRNSYQNLIIDGLSVRGNLQFVLLSSYNRIKNYEPSLAFGGIGGSSGSPNVDYPFDLYSGGGRGNRGDILLWSGMRIVLYNPTSHDLIVFPNVPGSGTSFGVTRCFVTLKQNVIGFGDRQVDFKYYIKDYDNGDRVNYTREAPSINFVDDRIYSSESVAGSVADVDILVWNVTANVTAAGAFPIAYRGKSNDASNTFDIFYISYTEIVTSASDTSLTVSPFTEVNVTTFYDTQITEADKAIVDAYTTIDNNNEAYDALKAYLYDNFAGETETIVFKDGDFLDCRAYNLTIDATAAAAVAFDGTTITLKSSSYTGSVKTSGLVAFANGATLTGGIIDVNGDSFLQFEGIQDWEVYDSQANANTQTAALGTGTVPDIFRFSYVPATTYYTRLTTTGGVVFFREVVPIAAGPTIVDLDTVAILTSVSNDVQRVSQKTDTAIVYASKADNNTIGLIS